MKRLHMLPCERGAAMSYIDGIMANEGNNHSRHPLSRAFYEMLRSRTLAIDGFNLFAGVEKISRQFTLKSGVPGDGLSDELRHQMVKDIAAEHQADLIVHPRAGRGVAGLEGYEFAGGRFQDLDEAIGMAILHDGGFLFWLKSIPPIHVYTWEAVCTEIVYFAISIWDGDTFIGGRVLQSPLDSPPSTPRG